MNLATGILTTGIAVLFVLAVGHVCKKGTCSCGKDCGGNCPARRMAANLAKRAGNRK